ncbi:MAG: hypothetical protein ABI142_08800 [Bryocella sp.]
MSYILDDCSVISVAALKEVAMRQGVNTDGAATFRVETANQ